MIRTGRLFLRRFREEDLDAFAAVLRDPGAMAPWGGPYTSDHAAADLRHYLDHDKRYGFAPFAVFENDVFDRRYGLAAT